jgi:hypothetical protein
MRSTNYVRALYSRRRGSLAVLITGLKCDHAYSINNTTVLARPGLSFPDSRNLSFITEARSVMPLIARSCSRSTGISQEAFPSQATAIGRASHRPAHVSPSCKQPTRVTWNTLRARDPGTVRSLTIVGITLPKLPSHDSHNLSATRALLRNFKTRTSHVH